MINGNYVLYTPHFTSLCRNENIKRNATEYQFKFYSFALHILRYAFCSFPPEKGKLNEIHDLCVCCAVFHDVMFWPAGEMYIGKETIKDNKAENCGFVDSNLHLKNETQWTYAYPKSRLFINRNPLFCTRMPVLCSVLGMILTRNSSSFSSETPDHCLLLERGWNRIGCALQDIDIVMQTHKLVQSCWIYVVTNISGSFEVNINKYFPQKIRIVWCSSKKKTNLFWWTNRK